VPTPEVPAVDVDTIVVDTSILDKVPNPAVGVSQSTSTSPAAALGKENQDAVSPASTQVITCFPVYSLGLLYFSYTHLFLIAG
jgi:hypothetical protein